MATLNDALVRELLENPNYAVISTLNANGSLHNTMVWIGAEDGAVAVNSAEGRLWPTNLERDPRVTVLVFESGNPYHYVEIRGTATATHEGADEHINALAKKYIGQDELSVPPAGRAAGQVRDRAGPRPAHEAGLAAGRRGAALSGGDRA